MTTPAQPLRASPIQIENHEFLDVEVHAGEGEISHTGVGLFVSRICARHDGDPRRWRLEMTVRFGGESDGKSSVYFGMLRIAGYFCVSAKYPDEKVRDLVEVTGASILYGACREMLATITARGSQGMISLPSVTFAPIKREADKVAAPRVAEESPAAPKKRNKGKN